MTWVVPVPVFFQLFTSVKIFFLFLLLCIYRDTSTQESGRLSFFICTKYCKFWQLRNIRKTSATILVQYRQTCIRPYSNNCLLSKLMPQLNFRKANWRWLPPLLPSHFIRPCCTPSTPQHIFGFLKLTVRTSLTAGTIGRVCQNGSILLTVHFHSKEMMGAVIFPWQSPSLEKHFPRAFFSPSQSLCSVSCSRPQF